MKTFFVLLLLVASVVAQCYYDVNLKGFEHTMQSAVEQCYQNLPFCKIQTSSDPKNSGWGALWSCGYGCTEEGTSTLVLPTQNLTTFCCKGDKCNYEIPKTMLPSL